MEFLTQETLVHETCCECGIQFTMPRAKQQGCKSNNDRKFYCPNGHAMTYTRTNEDVLRDKVTHLEVERSRLAQRLDEEMRRRQKAESTNTQLRRRLAANKRKVVR